MTTFAKTGFNAASYAKFRPSYPPKVFSTVLAYHRGPKNLVLDLGCGHGPISRELSASFKQVLATDPSNEMVKQAKSSSTSYKNIEIKQGNAEDLSDIADGSLDMVVAGQAAHWFDYSKVWPELKRKVREWRHTSVLGYKDNLFVDYPAASKILDNYCYGPNTMGPFWEQPGRNILRDLLRDVVPPEEDWEDVRRTEYEPGLNGKGSGRGELLMERRLKLGEIEGYTRTFSSFVNWANENKDKKSRLEGGEGDIVDEMFDKMLEAEPEWKKQGDKWRDFEVENEWGSIILLARKK